MVKRYHEDKPVLIDNGSVRPTEGYRRVAFTPEGEICPVHHVVDKGLNHERHTVQQAYSGCGVITYSWPGKHWYFGIIDGEVHRELKGRELVPYINHIRVITNKLRDWFACHKPKPSFLPAGYGWDGERTMEQREKEKSWKKHLNMLPEDVLAEVLEAMHDTPETAIHLEPVNSAPLPFGNKITFGYYSRTRFHRNWTYDHWVLYHRDHRRTFVRGLPPETLPRKDWGDVAQDAVPFPDDVDRMMKITMRAIWDERENEAYGVSFEHFERKRWQQRAEVVEETPSGIT